MRRATAGGALRGLRLRARVVTRRVALPQLRLEGLLRGHVAARSGPRRQIGY
jgi:hypothetical protein